MFCTHERTAIMQMMACALAWHATSVGLRVLGDAAKTSAYECSGTFYSVAIATAAVPGHLYRQLGTDSWAYRCKMSTHPIHTQRSSVPNQACHGSFARMSCPSSVYPRGEQASSPAEQLSHHF